MSMMVKKSIRTVWNIAQPCSAKDLDKSVTPLYDLCMVRKLAKTVFPWLAASAVICGVFFVAAIAESMRRTVSRMNKNYRIRPYE